MAAAPAPGAAGLKLDPSFGRHGVAEPRFPPHFGHTSFLSIEVQPDGSLLAARHGADSAEDGVTYRHYDASGHLDRGFKPQRETPEPEAVDADGKTLRAGSNFVERLEPDGTKDPSFGIDPSGGRPFSDILSFTIEELLPTPSGKILVVGSIPGRDEAEEQVEQVIVARLDHSGRLDPGFGGDGLVKLRSEAGVAGEGLVGALVRGEEGVLLLVNEEQPRRYEGQAMPVGGSAVLALAADGRPDPGFGEGGAVRSESSIESFAKLPGGGLVLAGNRWGEEIRPHGPHTSDLYAARLTPAGQYDPGFGGNGIATVDFDAIDLTGALLVRGDGSVVLGGSSVGLGDGNCVAFEGFCRETPVLAGLRPDGVLDRSFGGDGKVRLEELAGSFVLPDVGRGVRALAGLPGGGVLAGGGSGTVAFIAALDGSGAPVRGFGKAGVVIERDREANETSAHAAAIDGRQRILVAGETDADALFSFESGAVFRFRPDGRIDRGYGGGDGYVRVPGNTRDIALGPGGDAFVLSGEFGPNILVHVTAKGTVDRRYGIDGVARLPRLPDVRRHGKRHSRELDPRSLVVLPGGGVLVGGEGGAGGESRIVLSRFDRRGHLDRRFGRRGVAILALGQTRQCNMSQLALRRDGRILIAGRVRERGEGGRRPALFQLLPNGAPDPGFGRRGVAQIDLGTESMASSLAIEGNGTILLAGRQEIRRKTKPLLFRFSRDGILDRRFARRMLASSPSSRRDEGLAPREILPTASGILAVSPFRPVLSFSRSGAFRGRAPFDRAKKPRRSLSAGVLQGGKPLLIGEIGESRGLIMRRYLGRGDRR